MYICRETKYQSKKQMGEIISTKLYRNPQVIRAEKVLFKHIHQGYSEIKRLSQQLYSAGNTLASEVKPILNCLLKNILSFLLICFAKEACIIMHFFTIRIGKKDIEHKKDNDINTPCVKNTLYSPDKLIYLPILIAVLQSSNWLFQTYIPIPPSPLYIKIKPGEFPVKTHKRILETM